MKFIIQLGDNKYVKRSLTGWKLDPIFCDNPYDAEVWIDQKAAITWCEEQNVEASVIPIDVPVVAEVKPKVKKVTASKAVDDVV